MRLEVDIPDEILAHFSEWQKIAGIKLVVIDGRLDIILAADAAGLAAAKRHDRTPKVATQPGETGNIRWR